MAAQQTSDSKQTDQAIRKATRPAVDSPTAQHGPEAVGPAAMASALADPSQSSPSAILQLQRKAGNRAVQRLLSKSKVQAKLTVGPAGDKYEQEADRVANQVMSASVSEAAPPNQTQQKEEDVQRFPLTAAISSIRRQALEDEIQEKSDSDRAAGEGFTAGSDVEHRLATTWGGGKSMPSDTRSFMESRFGSDFSGVRVHTGNESVQLNRDLSAQAFTHGSDVYFGEGKYNPGTHSGKQLLAHELTHVVQQGGAAPNKTQRKFEVSEVTQPDLVQGKWTDTVKNAGKAIKGAGKSVAKAGKKLSNKVRSLWGRADRSDEAAETENPVLEGTSVEDQSTFANIMHGSLAASMPEYEDPTLAEQEPDNYKVTLAAAQEDVNWLRNVKELKKTALKTAVSSPKQFYAGVTSNPEEFMARKVLSKRGELDGKTESEQQELIKKFSGGIHDVGHTWVRLSTYVNGKLQRLWSFGFWPLKLPNPFTSDNEGGYAGFAKPGPGQVKHPDVAHESDTDKAYMDYDVKPKQFEKAMGKATKRFTSPPPYVLIGYNCTAFAREVLMVAGKSYPSKGLILPGVAYTPGGLYAAIIKESKKKGNTKAHTDDAHSDIVKQVGEDVEERQAEAQSSVMKGYLSGAPRETLTLRVGGSLRLGDYPIDRRRKKMKVLNIQKAADVTVIRDDEFTNVWDVVPVEFGPKLAYAHPKDLKAATKKSKPTKEKPSEAPSGGKPNEGILTPLEGKPIEFRGSVGDEEITKPVRITIEDEDRYPNFNDWDSVFVKVEGLGYGQIYWDSIKPYFTSDVATTTELVETDVDRPLVVDPLVKYAHIPNGTVELAVKAGQRLMTYVSLAQESEATEKILQADSNLRIQVADGTKMFGRCKVWGYGFMNLEDLFDESGQPSANIGGGGTVDEVVDEDLDDLSEDTEPMEVGDSAQTELDKVVNDDLVKMLGSSQDLDMAVTSWGVPSQIKALSPEARKLLADRAGMSLEELNKQIENL